MPLSLFEVRDGGAEGTRTPYLFHAMEALYQMSYSPKLYDDAKEIAGRAQTLFDVTPRCAGLGR